LANVSATTVSLVLAGKAGNRRISEDTHRRVKKAAEDLNYAPNLLTRSLRRGRTHIFSFFSTFRNREEHDMYMNSMVSAVESAGGQAGYDVLVHCNFKRSPKEIYQFLKLQHNATTLAQGLELLGHFRWATSCVEQGHVGASFSMKRNKSRSEASMRARATRVHMRPMLL
jgi:hypothetical protein